MRRRVPEPIAKHGIKIAGRGWRLLDGVPSIRLEPMRNQLSPTGSLLVDYRIVRIVR